MAEPLPAGDARPGKDLREEEIRPADLKARLREYMLRDRDRWLAGRPDWVKVPCPACGETEGRAFEVREYTFMECAGCGTAWHNPRPSVAQLGDYYANAESYGFWAADVACWSRSAPVRSRSSSISSTRAPTYGRLGLR